MNTIQKHVLSAYQAVQNGQYDVTLYLPEIIAYEFGELLNSHYYSVDRIALPRCGNPIDKGDNLKVTQDVPHDGNSMELLRGGDIVEFVDVETIDFGFTNVYFCIVAKNGESFKVEPKYLAIVNPYSKQGLEELITKTLAPYRDAKRAKELQFEAMVRG